MGIDNTCIDCDGQLQGSESYIHECKKSCVNCTECYFDTIDGKHRCYKDDGIISEVCEDFECTLKKYINR